MSPDRAVRILFVCTANVCRSPLAAAMMAKHAAAAGVKVKVSSAGIDDERRALHTLVVKILAEHGLELVRGHSQPLREPLVAGADLILTMTAEHALAVAARHRGATKKVFMLGHFAAVARPRADGEDLAAWLADVCALPRLYPGEPDPRDITDPIGRDEETFRAVATQIDALTSSIALLLATPR